MESIIEHSWWGHSSKTQNFTRKMKKKMKYWRKIAIRLRGHKSPNVMILECIYKLVVEWSQNQSMHHIFVANYNFCYLLVWWLRCKRFRFPGGYYMNLYCLHHWIHQLCVQFVSIPVLNEWCRWSASIRLGQ